MGKVCLALGSKRNHPKEYQVSKSFLYKKQVYSNKYMVYINSVSCNYKN